MDESDLGHTLAQQLLASPVAARRQLLLDRLAAMVAELPPPRPMTTLKPEQKIFELGLGSLIIIDLKTRLEEELGVELPVILFFQHASLGQLADHLLSVVAGDAAEPEPPTAPSASPDEDLEERITGLSEDEAESELRERLDALDEPKT